MQSTTVDTKMYSKCPTIIITIITIMSTVVCCYRVGLGRADCTGPPVEIGFMGYAQLGQKGQGIHLRQFARAFIIEQNNNRIVFVSVDAAMMGWAVKREVVSKLNDKYGNMYTEKNVAISGTHTHATPGGFLMHVLYDISILGFVPETYNALIDGIYNSIVRAHDSMQDGRIFISETQVLEANINRSPTSYLENPEEERAQYQHDVDKTLTQIRFVNKENEVIGAFNWFAVHPTSMNNTNTLVSSDNVGYASILLEKEYNIGDLPGRGKFVGAFCSSNLGDVSPNIVGPRCQFTGESCDLLTSACPKNEGQCVASGPGKDMFESTQLIAQRLYKGASTLLGSNVGREINGAINFIHQFVDMPKYRTLAYNPLTKKTEKISGCVPAMGYSFAAGTTDGPGAFNFEQGTTTDNIFWNAVRDFIVPPTKEDVSCHAPKPILLATGRANFPVPWQPTVVATQLLQIGDVIFACVPGEFTTMSGRRLRKRIRSAAFQVGGNEVQVVLAGLSNIYTSYITTPEEYQAQRYEAASTIYGPQTLTIYIDQYEKLVQAMISGESVDSGPTPQYLNDRVLSFNTGVVYDGHPIGRDFGYVKSEPDDSYTRGDLVQATFVAANPRNNIMHEKSFITIEQQDSSGVWVVVHTDANWETKFYWKRVSTILGLSDVEVLWQTDTNTKPGVYRIRHFGSYKFILGGIFPYEGVTKNFLISL